MKAVVLLTCIALWTFEVPGGEIHDAASTGDTNKFKALLVAEPSAVNQQDADGNTPLHLAIRANNQGIVEIALQFKPTLQLANKAGLTPLKLAKGYGRTELVKLLTDNGVTGEANDHEGRLVAKQRLVPAEVLAFYYPWYGSPEKRGHPVHWGKIDSEQHTISNCAHYPLKGVYDSMDPALIDEQISLAQSNGITGFIASWWGQDRYEDHALPVLLDRAAEKHFKCSVYWEKASGEGDARINQAASDLVYLLTRYGTNEAFLKVGSKPVIFLYGRVLDQIRPSAWPAIASRARAKAGEVLLIADGYKEEKARHFDGVHNYNISWAAAGKPPLGDLRSWAARYDSDAVQLARKHGIISCVTVIPGYDDRNTRRPGRNSDRQDGQVYRVLWEEAIKSKPDWVLITSWNEWHEGSEIEASTEYGDKYLKLTGDYAWRFLAR